MSVLQGGPAGHWAVLRFNVFLVVFVLEAAGCPVLGVS